MHLTRNKETLYRLCDAVNRGDFPALDHIFASDMVEHTPLFCWLPPTCEGVKQSIRLLREAFPDIQFDFLDIVAEKDKVWTRMLMTGTQKGEFNGVPATGKRVQVERIDIYRLCQGIITEHWCIMEQLTLFQQLGEYLSMEALENSEMRIL